MFVIIDVIALTAAILNSSASADPLAPAENGQLQCYRPDAGKKTCQSIASYQRTGPGTYDNKAVVAISNDATLETHTPVVIKGGAVCGYLRAEDMLAGTLRYRGSVVAPDKAQPVLQRIAHSIEPFAAKEICTTYEPSGSDFTAKVTVGGLYRSDQDVKVKWINAIDGYTVTP